VTRNLLLLVHIASAAAWLGANFVQLTVGRRMLGRPDETAARWAETTGRLVSTYYNVAGAGRGGTGLTLARLVKRNVLSALFDSTVVLTTILAMVSKWRTG